MRMTSPVLGEFLGTMIMILLGDGVVAAVLLKKTKAENSGWMVITTAWAFAVMVGVFVSNACGSKDAFLNPAFTLGFAIYLGDYSKLASYLPAQLAGAFVGAVLVFLHYGPHWKVSDDPVAKLAIFCTGPAIRSFAWNLLSEIIGTFVLVFAVGTMVSKAVAAFRSAPPPATRLIRRATSDRESRTPCCRSPGRAVRTGATPGFRLSGRSLARRSRDCCFERCISRRRCPTARAFQNRIGSGSSSAD
jgi:glycerol uptake facilitator-like aquaporin